MTILTTTEREKKTAATTQHDSPLSQTFSIGYTDHFSPSSSIKVHLPPYIINCPVPFNYFNHIHLGIYLVLVVRFNYGLIPPPNQLTCIVSTPHAQTISKQLSHFSLNLTSYGCTCLLYYPSI